MVISGKEEICCRLQLLDQQCQKTLKTAYRPNTARNFRSKANIYLKFCQLFQLTPFPTTEWNLIRFARFIANGVTSYDTVKGYLSGIKRFHEIARFKFPTNLYTLKLEMMAIKRELAGPVKKAVPVTPQLLSQIYSKVNLKNMLEVVCYVALLVGFCLFLRKSNLVPDTEGSFNEKEQLTRGDVWRSGKLTIVDIKWSKTNQYRARELLLPLIPAKNKKICPVYWINYLFAMNKNAKLTDPLFGVMKCGKMAPVTYEVLADKYKEWICALGKSDQGHTLQGLCRGV